jgi:hypothetical protein
MLSLTQTSKRANLEVSSRGPSTGRKQARQEVCEIAFEQLRATDSIQIRTAYSSYLIVLIDAKERHGILFGGRYQPATVPAMLVGVEILTGGEPAFDDRRLRTGARALFFTGSHRDPGRLVTSEILSLSYGKSQ